MKNWNVSQARVARVLNTGHKTVGKWLEGNTMPSSEYIIKLTIVFDCSVEDLVLLDPYDIPELL